MSVADRMEVAELEAQLLDARLMQRRVLDDWQAQRRGEHMPHDVKQALLEANDVVADLRAEVLTRKVEMLLELGNEAGVVLSEEERGALYAACEGGFG